VHPFDDPLVIAGQGTIGREILEQLPDVTHIFVPVGGGGLIAGIASYVKAIRPDVRIISVEPEDSNAMQQSIDRNERVNLPYVGIFADGVAVKQVGQHTFEAAQNKVDDFITVTTDQICAGIKNVFEATRSIMEPAGALAVAGIAKYKLPPDAYAVAVCSGANMTFERLQQISERTLIGSGREAMFAVTMPEKPGALHTFCSRVVNGHNISEFNYRLAGRGAAHVLVSVNVSDENDKQELMKKMKKHDYEFVDLTNDELAKEHVRHMIGGKSPAASQEHLYEVAFPERPGALGDFLNTVGDTWNISLFHYRSAASDSGSVMIGFESSRPKELEEKLRSAGFAYNKVNDNLAVATFLSRDIK
jgi:threonine dehydratase